MSKEDDHRSKKTRKMSPVSPQGLEAMAIPFLIGVGPIVGWFLGDLADGWIGCEPWGQFIGLIFGLAAGIHQSAIIIRRISK